MKTKADFPVAYCIHISDIPYTIVQEHPTLRNLPISQGEQGINGVPTDIGWVSLEVESMSQYHSFTRWLMDRNFTHKDNILIYH